MSGPREVDGSPLTFACCANLTVSLVVTETNRLRVVISRVPSLKKEVRTRLGDVRLSQAVARANFELPVRVLRQLTLRRKEKVWFWNALKPPVFLVVESFG